MGEVHQGHPPTVFSPQQEQTDEDHTTSPHEDYLNNRTRKHATKDRPRGGTQRDGRHSKAQATPRRHTDTTTTWKSKAAPPPTTEARQSAKTRRPPSPSSSSSASSSSGQDKDDNRGTTRASSETQPQQDTTPPAADKDNQENEELSSEEVAKDLALLDILNYKSADQTEDKKTRHKKDKKKKKKNKKEKCTKTTRHQAATVTSSEGAAQGQQGKGRHGGTFHVDPRSVGAAPACGPFTVATDSITQQKL